tara:strand:- start:868 stop:1101 length:234 start_codon:yes stop_codon:yes gene_type:complete
MTISKTDLTNLSLNELLNLEAELNNIIKQARPDIRLFSITDRSIAARKKTSEAVALIAQIETALFNLEAQSSDYNGG